MSVKWQETTKRDKVKQRVSHCFTCCNLEEKGLFYSSYLIHSLDSGFYPYGYIIIRSVPILLCVFSIYWFRLVMVGLDESYFLADNPLVTKVHANAL